MSKVRQYIGARYVLKIYENSQNPLSADWESGVAFEPLVLVTYQNSSYISKKDVPATVGAPSENPRYWTVTGLYNGQIVELQNSVAAINEALELLEGGFIDSQDRNILFIGDSYAANDDYYANVCANYMGCDITVVANGGAGFQGNGTGPTFAAELATAASDDYTDIIFAGGYNDKTPWYGPLRTAVINTLESAKTLYPNANIWVAMVGNSTLSENLGLLANVNMAYQQGCVIANAKFINLSSSLLDANGMQDDGIHPNASGQVSLARGLAQALMGGNGATNMAEYLTSFKDMANTDRANTVKYGMNNGISMVNIAQITCEPTEFTMVCDGNHQYTVGHINKATIIGSGYNSVLGWCFVRKGSHYYTIHGVYHVNNGDLIFTPRELTHDSEPYGSAAGWITLEGIDWINIPRLTFMTIPYLQ